jgi:hypothetical protein
MVRRFRQLAVVVGVLVIGGLGFAGVASAASGYPPPTTGGTSCSLSESINVGSSASLNPSCRFAPGSTVTITLNGAAYDTLTVPASGVLAETLTATDPHVALNGGTVVATKYGETNVFVASGTNPAGASNVVTTLATIPAAVSSSAAASGLAFTGSYVMAMVMGSLAVVALGFLILTFSRRRIPPASAV